MKKEARRVMDLIVVMGILMVVVSVLHNFTGLQVADLGDDPVFDDDPNSINRGMLTRNQFTQDKEMEEVVKIRKQSLTLKRYPIGLAYGPKQGIFKRFTPLDQRCTDTDVINDPYKKGFIRIYSNPENPRSADVYVDYCMNYKTLIQYDCQAISQEVKIATRQPCPSSCDEGACSFTEQFIGPGQPFAVAYPDAQVPSYGRHSYKQSPRGRLRPAPGPSDREPSVDANIVDGDGLPLNFGGIDSGSDDTNDGGFDSGDLDSEDDLLLGEFDSDEGVLGGEDPFADLPDAEDIE